MKLKDVSSLEEKLWQHIKKWRNHFANKGLYSQSYGFSSSHVWMWDLDHNEGWMPKNWCFWIVVLEKTLESPLDSKDIKPVNPKGNQPWIFIGRTDAEAEALVLQLLDAKRGPIVKDPDAGEDWRQKEKGVVEDEAVGWHHWLHGHEFEQTLGDSEGQTGLLQSVGWLRVRYDLGTEQWQQQLAILTLEKKNISHTTTMSLKNLVWPYQYDEEWEKYDIQVWGRE